MKSGNISFEAIPIEILYMDEHALLRGKQTIRDGGLSAAAGH